MINVYLKFCSRKTLKVKKIIFYHRRIVIDVMCLSKFQYHLNNNMAVSFSGERDRITRSKTTDIPLLFSLSLNLYYIILWFSCIFMNQLLCFTLFTLYVVIGRFINNLLRPLSTQANIIPFRSTWVHSRFLVGFVLLDLYFYE